MRNLVAMLMFGTALQACVADSMPPSAKSPQLPAPSESFTPGTGAALAQANCQTCHPAAYVTAQRPPRAEAGAFWRSTVDRMVEQNGAPISRADAERIIAYLSSNYRSQ